MFGFVILLLLAAFWSGAGFRPAPNQDLEAKILAAAARAEQTGKPIAVDLRAVPGVRYDTWITLDMATDNMSNTKDLGLGRRSRSGYFPPIAPARDYLIFVRERDDVSYVSFLDNGLQLDCLPRQAPAAAARFTIQRALDDAGAKTYAVPIGSSLASCLPSLRTARDTVAQMLNDLQRGHVNRACQHVAEGFLTPTSGPDADCAATLPGWPPWMVAGMARSLNDSPVRRAGRNQVRLGSVDYEWALRFERGRWLIWVLPRDADGQLMRRG